jgi:hypothetical protein
MSYGTQRVYKSKKALREDVAARGAHSVGVFGTSMFGDESCSTIEELADSGDAIIVGPDVYSNRQWYATVSRKKDGTILIK